MILIRFFKGRLQLYSLGSLERATFDSASLCDPNPVVNIPAESDTPQKLLTGKSINQMEFRLPRLHMFACAQRFRGPQAAHTSLNCYALHHVKPGELACPASDEAITGFSLMLFVVPTEWTAAVSTTAN